MRDRHTASIMMAVILLGLGSAGIARADETNSFAARVQADTAWLSSFATRQVGTEEHRAVQDALLEKVKAIPGTEVWVHEFPVVVPVYEETYLELDSGEMAGQHTIHPIWPDVARLNTTPRYGISGRFRYIGEAELADMPAQSLRGNIAVMELSAYGNYRRAFDFGAVAVILLESDEPGRSLMSGKQSLYKPRYYVPEGPLADALRSGALKEGRILCRGSWQEKQARNIYVGVKGSGAQGDKPYAVVAPYDSMSKVYGVAPGADIALDAATVLNLLRDEAADPSRSLLFGFLDAYHLNHLGMRYMAAMLSVTPDGRTRKAYTEIEQERLEAYQAALEEFQSFESADAGLAIMHDRSRAKHIRRLYKDAVGPEVLRLKQLQGELRLASQRRAEENTLVTREEILGILEEGRTWLLEHHAQELTEEDHVTLEAAAAFVEEQRLRMVEEEVAQPTGDVLADAWDAFEVGKQYAAQMLAIYTDPIRIRNRVLETVYRDGSSLQEQDVPVARMLWNRMADRIEQQHAEQLDRLNFFTPMDAIRRQIVTYFGVEGDPELTSATALVVGLDLSDCGLMVGPGLECPMNRIPGTDRRLERALRFAVRRGDIWPEGSDMRRSVNLPALSGRPSGGGWIGARPLVTSSVFSFGLQGITWLTDDADRLRPDSPLDTFDRLDWARITPQLAPSLAFLQWLFTSDDYEPDVRPVGESTANWRHGMGRVVAVSAGETVPRVPRPGFLCTFVGGGSSQSMDGIRRHNFGWTDADGALRIPLMPAKINRYVQSFDLVAVLVDEWGNLVESLSTTESMVSTRLTTTFNLGNKPGDQLPRVVTFGSTELNGPSFFDVRFLEPLQEASLLDALRGGSPKQATFSMDEHGQMWGLVEPDIRWQIILRAGATRIRMALLNALENGRELGLDLRGTFQRGFAVEETLETIPEYIAARDLYTLNEWRLTDYRSAGIESGKIDEIRKATRTELEVADGYREADDGAGLKRAASKALANEIRAYQAVKEMGMDISRGAIFLMLMLVPFSIAMERLLFAAAHVGRQIIGALAIFAGMTALLWSFHPAFRISAQPLVIVMSFAILAMSLVVISMVLKRFKASVQEFQSSLAEGSGANMGRGGVLGSAVFLGIANMRKRKVRTFLTGSTIVLVTFALLCFSSASSYIDKKDFKLEGVTAPNASVLIRRPTFGELNWHAAAAVHNLLGHYDVKVGERAWLGGGLGEITYRLHLLNPQTGEQLPVQGALGVPPVEDALSGIDRVLPNWEQFAADGGCYLPDVVAEAMEVQAGDTIVLRGVAFVVRGVFDPLVLEDDIRLLDGQRITPYDYTQQAQDWINRDSQDVIEQETSSAAAMQPTGDESEIFTPARSLIILPTAVTREFGGTLRSIGIACADTDQAVAVANELMKTIVYPAYYTNKDGGVSVVVATPLVAIPPKNLAIPLVIAALIIFTTMLNSVSERKKEIYVYTSLGLAPTHVGVLFVAEALTYGLMGAVFGYIAGQATATVLSHFDFMTGITLNYSGTAVIKTMLLVQGVVVLSAIVPAVVAGRIAAPSTEMDWKVPTPEDGVIRDMLPFTVNEQAAPGLIAFLCEYLDAHRDGVLGGFDVDQIQVLPPGTKGSVAALEARLWLEPYDMGVRQKLRILVNLPEDETCSISAEIVHEAGAEKVWWRLNKPFFSDVRRQLLGWRKLSADRILAYLEEAETLEKHVTEDRPPA